MKKVALELLSDKPPFCNTLSAFRIMTSLIAYFWFFVEISERRLLVAALQKTLIASRQRTIKLTNEATN